MIFLKKISQILGNFMTHDGATVLTYHSVNDKLQTDKYKKDR